MERPTDTDVFVVGAGPTGLMLANQLRRRGVRTLVIDRHAGPAQQTRALGVQARTLEIYAKLGLAGRALELGKRGTGANLWANGRRTARVPFGDAGHMLTRYAFILVLGQDDRERILGEKLAQQGLAVQWNTELAGIEQGAASVTATIRGPDGTSRAVTAAWVGGGDGARSAVRETGGITFPGAPYEHVFYVADIEATGSMVPDEVNVYLWRKGFHLFFPMRGTNHWRLAGIVPPGLRDVRDVAFEAVLPSVHDEAAPDLDVSACTWFSTYRIQHRSAARFRARRCFLLGDAAHVHSPVGAQGMNTGLQDAYNLAWKLALVVRGEADAALLDSYEAERVPVAQRLLATTDRAFRLAVSDNPIAGLLRTQVIARIAAFAMRRASIQRFAFRTVSQIGIHYCGGALSHSTPRLPDDAPQAGDRFPWLRLVLRAHEPARDMFDPLDDTRFGLIVFGQEAPAGDVHGFDDLLRVHVIPDGHVGLGGVRLDGAAVTDCLCARVRLRPERGSGLSAAARDLGARP